MKLKDSTVSLKGVQWQMFHAAVIAEGIYEKYGAELVITSANDGKHGKNTLHDDGLALDLRTWSLQGREVEVAAQLQKALGDEYDVVLEADHLHIEWDPA